MIGYVTPGAKDLQHAAPFYDAISAELGAAGFMEFDGFIAWGSASGAGIGLLSPYDGNAPSVGNGVMVAFAAKDQAQVDRIHEIAPANGGTCEGPPGARSDNFYAAYFRDRDGHKLNAYVIT